MADQSIRQISTETPEPRIQVGSLANTASKDAERQVLVPLNSSGKTELHAFNMPTDTAEPPPEIVEALKEQGLEDKKIAGWVSIPSLTPLRKAIPRSKLHKNGVDAKALFEPLLGNPVLDGTLRMADVMNGCGHHCDTCLADAVLPSRMFSYESLEELFSDERFIKMLQPDSLRFGSAGDIMDHPRAVDIVKLALDKTRSLDEQRMASESKHHQIKIFTNYRKKSEAELDKLFELARQNPDRLRVTVSLPFNRTDVVNKQFADFAKARPKVFPGKVDGKGFFHSEWFSDNGLKNVGVQDVRHPRVLFMNGRVLSDEANDGRVPHYDKVDVERDGEFSHRGFCKTFMNPDALWFMSYVSPYESHTHRIFTPLTPDNVGALSHLPYHPDFPTPPNWAGGKGVEGNYQKAQTLKMEARQSGKAMKQVTVVDKK
jgi:hypothetical protein